ARVQPEPPPLSLVADQAEMLEHPAHELGALVRAGDALEAERRVDAVVGADDGALGELLGDPLPAGLRVGGALGAGGGPAAGVRLEVHQRLRAVAREPRVVDPDAEPERAP